MTNDQFCYWLQGYFELRDADDPLTAGQREVILRHVGMCEVHMATRGGLGASVLAVRALLLTTADCTAAVVKILRDVFEHVIDPKAGDEEAQEKLNQVHTPNGRPPSPYRC